MINRSVYVRTKPPLLAITHYLHFIAQINIQAITECLKHTTF